MIHISNINKIVRELADELEVSRPLTFLSRTPRTTTSITGGYTASYTSKEDISKVDEMLGLPARATIDTTVVTWLEDGDLWK